MKIRKILDRSLDWPVLALTITKGSPSKSVRVCGVLLNAVTFFPLLAAWLVVTAILTIPAMIQEA